jgi:hypothetical protein
VEEATMRDVSTSLNMTKTLAIETDEKESKKFEEPVG